MTKAHTRAGILCALTAYFIWGVIPGYFKLFPHIPPAEIVSHRIIWSTFFMLFLVSVNRSWPNVLSILQQPKKILLLSLSAMLIATNWFLFIWAVTHGHILQASLGYFINPLLSLLIGVLFLGERFSRLQWFAVSLVICGVFVQLWKFGSIPLIALGISMSFSLYAFMRKKLNVEAQSGMLIETLWLLPVALIYLFGITDSPTSHLLQNPISLNLLLVSTGIVTTIPLVLFTRAATLLHLSTLGLFQYLAPSLMFLLAIFFYGETVTSDKITTFIFIWFALLIFIADGLYKLRRSHLS